MRVSRLMIMICLLVFINFQPAVYALPNPYISSFNPSVGWTSSSTDPKSGTLVKILGLDFDPIASKNEIYFTNASGFYNVKATVIYSAVKGSKYKFQQTMGSPGSQLGGLNMPMDVAIDKNNGDVYVVNNKNKRIEVYNSNGKPLRSIGSGKLSHPWYVAVDKKYIYVSETLNSQLGNGIAKFNKKTGSFIKLIGKNIVKEPRHIAVDQYENIYVIDQGKGKALFVKLDAQGKKIFALPGPQWHPFYYISGLALDKSGTIVYISDRERESIYKYNCFGLFFDRWDNVDKKWGLPKYFFPRRLVPDADGCLYVDMDGLIVKFDESTGKLLTKVQIASYAQDKPKIFCTIDSKKRLYFIAGDEIHVMTATDSEELWVHVPYGAKTGSIRIIRSTATESKAHTTSSKFHVLESMKPVTPGKIEPTQGVWSYPFVAGKETLIWTKLKGIFGHPSSDKAILTIKRPNGQTYKLEQKYIQLDQDYSKNETVVRFHVPVWKLNSAGQYTFEVKFERNKKLISSAWTKTIDFYGTKSFRLLFTKFTNIPPNQWGQKDPFPYFDMATFLYAIESFKRVFPLHTNELFVNFTAGKYLSYLSDGAQTQEMQNLSIEVSKIYNQNAGNADRSIGFIDASLNNTTASSGGQIFGWAGYNKNYIVMYMNKATSPYGMCSWGRILSHETGHTCGLVVDSKPNLDPNDKKNHHSQNFTLANEDGSPITVWNAVTDELLEGKDVCSTMSIAGSGNDRNCFESKYKNTEVDYYVLFNKFRNTSLKPASINDRNQSVSMADSIMQRFVVNGTIDTSGHVTIEQSYITDDDIPLTGRVWSGYSIAFLDSDDNMLSEEGFALDVILPDAADMFSDSKIFSIAASYPENTAKVELRKEKQVIKTLSPSQNPPVVSNVVVQLHEFSPPTILWNAKDPDNDPLTFSIDYSPDGGKTYKLIVADIQVKNYTWDHTLFPGSNSGIIRVKAYDGFFESRASSDGVDIPKKKPLPSILLPAQNSEFTEGSVVLLRGAAFDPEDGLLSGSKLSWMLDKTINLGSGETVRIRNLDQKLPFGTYLLPLKTGTHSIQLTATDSDQNQVTKEVNINIVTDTDRDGKSDDKEKNVGENPNDPFDIHSLYQYSAKFICGLSDGKFIAPGTYYTTINVHNPTDSTIHFKKKFALALTEEKPGPISPFSDSWIGPDEVIEFNCNDITRHFRKRDGCFDGFMVIETPAELDVVVVYTTAGSSGQIETFHTERVPPRKHKVGGCADLIIEKIEKPVYDDASDGSVIQVTVKNKGTAASSACSAQLVDPTTIDPKTNKPYSVFTSIPVLQAGSAVTITFSLPYWVYNPEAMLIVDVDNMNAVQECNENNNRKRFQGKG